MLTVVTFKWRGWRGDTYKAEHVNNLQRMLAMHLTIPHRLVCVTDDPSGIECETVQLWDDEHFKDYPKYLPNCFRRLFLFSKEAIDLFGPRALQIDLDCVITGNIDDLITDDPFRIVKGLCSPYNGSMWLLNTGMRPDIWSGLNRQSAKLAQKQRFNGRRFYGSDQAVMSHLIPDAPTWSEENGVYSYSTHIRGNVIPEDCKIIFFAGSTKPWDSPLKGVYWV